VIVVNITEQVMIIVIIEDMEVKGIVRCMKGSMGFMNENKRFTLTDFDTELEMLELLNTQAEVISDLSEQNEELKIKFNNCNTSYWKLNDENTHIKNTIKEMYNNERTALGKSVLKQLLEAIQ
jgi:hypothetical protein